VKESRIENIRLNNIKPISGREDIVYGGNFDQASHTHIHADLAHDIPGIYVNICSLSVDGFELMDSHCRFLQMQLQ
jgi:hypothetical protein